MADHIFVDINVGDTVVSDSSEFLLYDTKVIVQSVWRLLTTQVGEIPNFRTYGLDVKQFAQYPMTKDTVNEIYDYVKNRLNAFEQRAEIIQSQLDVDFNTGKIFMTFTIRVKPTNDIVTLPTWEIQIGAAS